MHKNKLYRPQLKRYISNTHRSVYAYLYFSPHLERVWERKKMRERERERQSIQIIQTDT
jgi:hypothetical protein